VKEPESEQAKRFLHMAELVWKKLEDNSKKAAPVFTTNLGEAQPTQKTEGFDV